MTAPLTVTADQLVFAELSKSKLRQAITGGATGAATLQPLATDAQYDSANHLDPPNPDIVRAVEDGPKLTALATIQAIQGYDTWHSVTLVNSWANTAGRETQYRRMAEGFVILRGNVTSGSGGIFTLPTDYRPARDYTFTTNAGGAHGLIYVATSGVVSLTVGSSTACLDGIRFALD